MNAKLSTATEATEIQFSESGTSERLACRELAQTPTRPLKKQSRKWKKPDYYAVGTTPALILFLVNLAHASMLCGSW